jgi:anion-transporting  ArsA/GET3 family ATPase
LDPAEFFHTSRVVIVAGKGGVGKTTVTAALARVAAAAGLTTLIVEVEGKSGIAELFGRPPLGYAEAILRSGGDDGAEIRGRTLTPDDALFDYLDDKGLRRVSKRLVASGATDVIATAAPGIKDILILGKVKQLERSGLADLIIVDAPAAGHAITFLQSARALLDAVRIGPINTQAKEVIELLNDPARCQVMLVTLPEETPVNELVETAFALEDRVGVALAPVVVNGVYPRLDLAAAADPAAAAEAAGTSLREGEAEALREAAEFRRLRQDLQATQLARLADRLPLGQLQLPFLFEADLEPAHLDLLAESLRQGIAAMEKVTS